MILTCNSCNKKFVVPDSAITESGRMVQCGSCGNKWRQFPVNLKEKKISTSKTVSKPTSSKPQTNYTKPKKPQRKIVKKVREINLYSPEYLAKKHGIRLNNEETSTSKIKVKNKVSFGFYSSLLVFVVLIIFLSRALYFSQNYLVALFPKLEFYLNYFFENIRNIFEIWKDLITY